MEPPAPTAGTSVFEAAPQRADADSNLPSWFADHRDGAWREFQSLPVPARTDENWRFADFKRLPSEKDGYQLGAPTSEDVAADILKRSVAASDSSARFVFANGVLIASNLLENAEGAICLPLLDAVREHGDLVRQHFAKRPADLGSARFAALNQAHAGAGVFVHVPKGIEISGPIEIFHWVSGDRATAFPHVIVHAEGNAQVSVIEHIRSHGDGDVFFCGATSLEAADGAGIRHAIAQDLSGSSKVVQINHATTGRDAEVRSLSFHAGGSWIRQESEGHIEGKGSSCNLLAVNLANGDQMIDHRTLQRHASSDAASDLLFKNALFDKARSIFAGLIVVDDKAHRTDAFQTCRNLLLSDEAEANSMPGLEINADQVKCSHGSTSGQIGDEEIFYLLARGIPAPAAKRLIIQGFAQDAIGKLDAPALEAPLSDLLTKKLDLV